MVEQHLDEYLQILRTKWFEVPFGRNRVSTQDLRKLSSAELVSTWKNARVEATTKSTSYDGFAARGWYHALYKPILQGKKVLDVGFWCGI